MLPAADSACDEMQRVGVRLCGEQVSGYLTRQPPPLVLALQRGIFGHGVQRHICDDAGEPSGFLVGIRTDELERPHHEAVWCKGGNTGPFFGV